jgi:3-deoxy-D-manno-octulosonic-acid transferase
MVFPLALVFYSILFPSAFALYLPWFITKLVRRGGFSRSFFERFGVFSRDRRHALRALDSPIWVHAVSVGETVAALGLIRRWQEREPDVPFVLSTTTTTGQAIARSKAPAGVTVIYCPVDCYFAVRRTLGIVRPRMLVIFEVEFWPNLICLSTARGIPVALVNGRLSDRSSRGYARHAWFFRPLFQQFSAICVQSDADAERVRRVAGDSLPVHVCGTMKFDQVPDTSPGDRHPALAQTFGTDDILIWTAGSTHPGEEELVLRVFSRLKHEFQELRLVLVPRHHERTADVERAVTEAGLRYRLLKGVAPGRAEDGRADVLVVNTTGELMRFYAVADVVFVGKTLAGNEGGHNIIEPAIFGKPVLHGPNLQNFRSVHELFRQDQATRTVADEEALYGELLRLLRQPGARAELGTRARAVVERYRGAMDRTIEILLPIACAPAWENRSGHGA